MLLLILLLLGWLFPLPSRKPLECCQTGVLDPVHVRPSLEKRLSGGADGSMIPLGSLRISLRRNRGGGHGVVVAPSVRRWWWSTRLLLLLLVGKWGRDGLHLCIESDRLLNWTTLGSPDSICLRHNGTIDLSSPCRSPIVGRSLRVNVQPRQAAVKVRIPLSRQFAGAVEAHPVQVRGLVLSRPGSIDHHRRRQASGRRKRPMERPVKGLDTRQAEGLW